MCMIFLSFNICPLLIVNKGKQNQTVKEEMGC